ncbi:MAG: DUF4438 domain-containing protein [Calditrichaeota bacterium]|nr:DUF4438 domain-containing protein [Calditrichota bacterium]RQW04640.1 MAG: DUF4438 domain-containing protein [Calditrichota bacterium]
MKLTMNTEHLVRLSVMGEINHPTLRSTGYVINSQGKAEVYPSVGGISYNIRIGDPAVGWMADHVEPGVSVLNTGKKVGEYSPNGALNVLACIGNKATISSGDAKGKTGFVTGKHGGIDHVLIDFEPDILENLLPGDKILIKSFGVGLKLLDYFPEIQVMNIDPELLTKLPLRSSGDGLEVGVSHLIPAKIMGSGIGSISAHSGDYDIQIFDESAINEYHLNDLKLGDIVAIIDSDASYGWIYRQGAVTVGMISHCNSVISGHGPGVTTIMTSAKGRIKPFTEKNANLRNFLP